MIGIIYKFTILASIKRDNSKPFYVGQHWEKRGLKHFSSSSVSNYPGSGTIWEELYLLLKRKFPTCWRKLIKREVLFYSENCSQKALDRMEEYFIKHEKSHYSYEVGGCNILWGTANNFGSGSPMKDPITAAKHSEKMKGRSFWTEERRKEFSKRMRGKNHPMFGVHRFGVQSPMFGKTHSEETKKKISQRLKGKKTSDATKKKISQRLMGENNPMKVKENTPMYGKIWITNGFENKSISKLYKIPDGWRRGFLKSKTIKS